MLINLWLGKNMCSKLDHLKFGRMFEVQLFYVWSTSIALYQIQLFCLSKMLNFCTKNLNRSSRGPSTSNQTIGLKQLINVTAKCDNRQIHFHIFWPLSNAAARALEQ